MSALRRLNFRKAASPPPFCRPPFAPLRDLCPSQSRLASVRLPSLTTPLTRRARIGLCPGDSFLTRLGRCSRNSSRKPPKFFSPRRREKTDIGEFRPPRQRRILTRDSPGSRGYRERFRGVFRRAKPLSRDKPDGVGRSGATPGPLLPEFAATAPAPPHPAAYSHEP